MHLNSTVKLLATDLDGTLLRSDKSISELDWNSLERLAEAGIVRVAATGRSLFKVREVLSLDAPFDYVVFSSGAGIYDWKNQQLLISEHFEKQVGNDLTRYLVLLGFNFFVFRPIPQNNLFWFHKGAGSCHEYESYLKRHEGDYLELTEAEYPREAGQIMIIIANHDGYVNRVIDEVYRAHDGVKVIRATSPLNPDFTWLEIFPKTVSKGHGIAWLCSLLNIDPKHTIGIGNDYNDSDMFDFVQFPFLLKNGVEALKEHCHFIDLTNNESAVAAVVSLLNL